MVGLIWETRRTALTAREGACEPPTAD